MERKNTYKEELKEMTRNSSVREKLSKLIIISTLDKERKFDNLINIVADEQLLWSAYEKIKPNKGATTPGTEKNETADGFNNKRIREISQKIRNGEYQWRNIRKKEIPKPGTKKKRPLGIPNFNDRIVQENIRVVLNTIYEPIFNELDVNHGFRPERSTSSAITKISEESQGMHFAIEGDFKGAYDNVCKKKLIETLEKKINDRKLIKLIKDSIYAKVEDENGKVSTSEKGVPQGGIASPILFNIYLQEFDETLIEEVEKMLKKKNENEKRTNNPHKRSYETARTKLNSIKKSIKKEYDQEKRKYKDFPKFKKLKKELKKRKTAKREIDPIARNKKTLFFSYTRYADDWIILTNANEKYCNEIKERIIDITKETIKIELNMDKTKITDLEVSEAKFLGFTIRNIKEKKFSEYKIKGDDNIRKRRINIGTKIGMDYQRILDRLRANSIIDKKNQPVHSAKLRILKTWQIVEKYTQIARGIINYYYYNLIDKSDLNYVYYLLKFSCLKTIANREKTSIRKVTMKYGNTIKVTYDDILWNEKEKKTKKINRKAEYPAYEEIMNWASGLAQKKMADRMEQKRTMTMIGKTFKNSKRIRTTEIEEIMNGKTEVDWNMLPGYKINLRSAYQHIKFCVICRANNELNNPIESHHVKHIKKGFISGFNEILKAINRKTIPCCRNCHKKIHEGKYNDFNLKKIMDIALATV